jgi:hypothetical protein
MLDGFGLIAFGALAPMIIIQLYGIVFFVPAEAGTAVLMMPSDDQHQYAALELLLDFLIMVRNLLPIIAVVLFSSFVILRRPLADPQRSGGGHGAGGGRPVHVRRGSAGRALSARRRDDQWPDARRRADVGALPLRLPDRFCDDDGRTGA